MSDTDPAASLGAPDWVDNLDNGNNWLTDNDAFTEIKFNGGYMKLTAITDLDGWRLSWPAPDDFYLEGKFQDSVLLRHRSLWPDVPAHPRTPAPVRAIYLASPATGSTACACGMTPI